MLLLKTLVVFAAASFVFTPLGGIVIAIVYYKMEEQNVN